MCTLAIFFRQSSAYPLVVAANRDEFLSRPAAPPLVLRDAPWVVGGMDLAAGGTWLGVNQHGLVAGLLNRRTGNPIDPSRQSRGRLCMDALACASVDEAASFVRQVRGGDYNAFNLLVASPTAAFVAQNIGEEVEPTVLEPGLHLLTNLDLNDPTCPRIAKSHRLFAGALPFLAEGATTELVARLREVLSDHSTPLDPRAAGRIDNLCVHLGGYGTRSSSIIIYAARTGRYTFLHAPGPPCETAFEETPVPPS